MENDAGRLRLSLYLFKSLFGVLTDVGGLLKRQPVCYFIIYIVTGPAGSFPNPSEGVLISEITFEANIEPEDRFPGYGLYKVAPKRKNYFST